MSQIFVETIAKAISDYRFMLRRHLNQVDRRKKLAELNLKDPTIFDSDLKLYRIAWQIVHDIENSVKLPTSYYAYSGMAEFAKFLKDYLGKYEIENGRLVHCAQKASKGMIQAIQYMSVASDKLNDDIATKLLECNQLVAKYGSDEQKDMYEGSLEQKLIAQRDFYTPIYNHYQSLLTGNVSDSQGSSQVAIG